MLDSGEVKNQADFARMKGISRVRVTQILNLLKLNNNFIKDLEEIGEIIDKRIISERKLQNITKTKKSKLFHFLPPAKE